jgi:hypothetical protein
MTINTTADNADNTSTTTRNNISDSEYAAYRAWMDRRIHDAGLAEGRTQASAAQMAEEKVADADALQRLTSKGLGLRDVFGNSSTDRGRGVLINIHRSSFGSKTTAYTRLRRMAAAEGLVK